MVRIKHRYLLINILSPEDVPKGLKKPDTDLPDLIRFRQPCPHAFNEEALRQLVRFQVQYYFGDYGAASLGASLRGKLNFILPPPKYSSSLSNIHHLVLVIYFSPATSTTIIRVAREHFRMVWAALCMTTRLPKPLQATPCVFTVVRTSGTVRKAQDEAIRRARETARRARGADVEDEVGGLERLMGAAAVVVDGAGESSEEDEDGDGEGDGDESMEGG
jgi:ribonuclease P/MRP protein subunit POP5